MRGTTRECLKHYIDGLGLYHRGPRKPLEPLATFCGTNTTVTYWWRSKDRLPNGLRYQKLKYFLEQKGYEVAELLALDPLIRELGRVIAYGFMTPEEVNELLGYVDLYVFYNVLNGNSGVSDEKLKMIQEICNSYSAQLESLKSNFPKVPPREESQPLAKESTQSQPPIQLNHDRLAQELKAIDLLVQAAMPELKSLLSKDTSAEDRREFRSKTGNSFTFEASNRFHAFGGLLNSLCSEKAREKNNGIDEKNIQKGEEK